MTIRAFLALEISDEARQGVENLAEQVRKGAQFTPARPSWTRPESMHLTLKFLGQIEEGFVERVAQRLEPACAALAPFEYGVRGLGVFPSHRRPRVVWIGVTKAAEELRRLHAVVEEQLAGLGVPRDQREFHPHLTLARLKSLTGAAALMKIVSTHGRQWCGQSRAERLVFFKSQLDPEGAIYTRLREFPFQAEAPGAG
jgi:2'-5' RNA ligase